MRKILGSICVLAALAVPGILGAHEGHDHVLGTVTAVDATRLRLRTKDGKTVTVPRNSRTKYFRGSKGNIAAKASAVKVGTRVVINVARDGTAEQIRISPASPTK